MPYASGADLRVEGVSSPTTPVTVRLSDGTNFTDTLAFANANATATVVVTSENRVGSDTLVLDPSGNVSNRARAAISLAASGGVGGGAIFGVGGGRLAVAHGANPTAITAANFGATLCNRAGIPFSICGHPNIITFTQNYTGAQTDAAVVTVSTGTIIVVVSAMVTCHNANTVNVSARVGFGTSTVPAYGNNGIILSHPGIGPGSGVGIGNGSGIIAIGADDQDIRLTLSVPTGGSADLIVKYFTISS